MSKPKLGPTGAVDVDVELAHRWSINHREELFTSEQCGCFYCLDIFPVEAIDDEVDPFPWTGCLARLRLLVQASFEQL
jgi:hypothetical protein